MEVQLKIKKDEAGHNRVCSIKAFVTSFFVMGFTYTNIELVFRGRTHVSMLVVGGLCGALVGLINEKYPKMKMWKQCAIGTGIIISLEFLSGYILNIVLKLQVWDYSALRFNFMGQISLLFAVLWFFLCIPVIWLDDYLRYKFFDGVCHGNLKDYLFRFIELK